jgi:hypothetical protein
MEVPILWSQIFNYVFSSSYNHTHFEGLLVNHWSVVVKHSPIVGVVNPTLTTIQRHLFHFSWEHGFLPKNLMWIITYFQCACKSPMESNCICNKKQGSMLVAFHSVALTTLA